MNAIKRLSPDAGDGRRNRIGGGDRLIPRCLQGGDERLDAAIGCREGVFGRQTGKDVGAAESNRTGVARGRVAERIEHFDREATRDTRRRDRWEAGDEHRTRQRRYDLNVRDGTRQRIHDRICCGQRLEPNGRQRSGQEFHARIECRERVVRGQPGL